MSFMQRQRNFWNEMIWKPKKPLSLDQLKYHYLTLERNPVVTESNKKLLVETFRSIAEILIWGDQNDSSVFDFFLEKNMQSYFLKILSKQPGRYVVLQLLQTMSILFENIKNETSIYYLLSNNHINSLIVMKLDYSDEEVLAYYISFLKTLSFKLNRHTIHFFYNEHLRDFPLYTEAIKFFNNPESMVRIAVRTLTLNVYKVEDKNTVDYICNKTAVPYFSNYVWFIGNHVIQLDDCLEQKSSHLKVNSLESAVAEHLDHLHYLNDILSLKVKPLNEILRDHLLNRLFVPLYVYSLFETSPEMRKNEDTPKVSSKIALFLLSQVFLIISHPVLTTELAYLILTGDQTLTLPPSITDEFESTEDTPKHRRSSSKGSIRGFGPPEASLTTCLNRHMRGHASPRPVVRETGLELGGDSNSGNGSNSGRGGESSSDSYSTKELNPIPEYDGFLVIESPSEREIAESLARSEEQRQQREEEDMGTHPALETSAIDVTPVHSIPINSNAFHESILSAIIPGPNDDSRSLFAIALFYGMIHNDSVSQQLLQAFSLKNHKDQATPYCMQPELIGRLLSVIEASAVGSVRLVTLHLCITLLSHLLHLELTYTSTNPTPSSPSPTQSAASLLSQHHLMKMERAMEEACRRMEKFYRSLGEGEEVFLELFEDEYSNEKKFFLKVNYLLMDATMLLPATGTPMTGIDFTKRLPCGETEKARKAMRVFFAIRKLFQSMRLEKEQHLPLTPSTTSVVTEDVIDTTNSDLVRCRIITGESFIERFLVVTESEFILVEPDTNQLGCGIVKFIAFLQDVDVSQDPADNVSLRVVAYHRSRSQIKRRPALTAKVTFEDNIRCLATRQNLQRKKDALRHKKMSIVAEMLGIPPPSSPVRKRDAITPVSIKEVTESVSVLTPPIQQHTISQSPHKHATSMLKGSSPVESSPCESESYELGSVDKKDIPVATCTPSPRAYYDTSKDEVMLSFGNDSLQSDVILLPPKSLFDETQIRQFSETDDDVEMNGDITQTISMDPVDIVGLLSNDREIDHDVSDSPIQTARVVVESRSDGVEKDSIDLHELDKSTSEISKTSSNSSLDSNEDEDLIYSSEPDSDGSNKPYNSLEIPILPKEHHSNDETVLSIAIPQDSHDSEISTDSRSDTDHGFTDPLTPTSDIINH